MAIQQLTQPILNPISAFDSTQAHAISFVVIGGAQVVGNRLIISNNRTGAQIYNKSQLTMKLEHIIPANTLVNGEYYNAVVYTIDNSGTESVASSAVPFYCYSQPVLTIDNIPATETIENGTYEFTGSYLQQENEVLNSYQYTLYNSNKEVLSQTPLIYYNVDSSLSYTFVGMSNDTSYYIELTGETVNGTKISSGIRYFTVRYLQPASFAICDLVNNCDDGYIQISSNIVAIDGISNPDPPIYIDDKEVDLREPGSWVEWNSGFRIQNDFTMRVWGRDFTPYENIITLTNELDSSTSPNKIELKWMLGDIIKSLPEYTHANDFNVNIINSETAPIEDLTVGGNSIQKKIISTDEVNNITMPSPEYPSKIYSVGDIKNLISVDNFNITYSQQYYQNTNTNFILKPNYIYTLSFDYNVNATSTDIYYSIGYGTTSYQTDIKQLQYENLSAGRNTISFIVPDNIPENNYLWVRFAKTNIIADINVDISNIQLESGNLATEYQTPNIYNIYPTSTSKNTYNYKTPIYIKKDNVTYNEIQNGYNIVLDTVNQDASLAIGCKNILNAGDSYAISFNQLGQLGGFNLYTTDKESQEITSEITITNNSFIAPAGVYDLQLVFRVDSSVATNYVEIWNIQIEASNIATEYEPYESNSSVITLDEPLRGIGNYRDLICLESPNILNPNIQSGVVTGNTSYYLNQSGNTTYYIWYYNSEGNLIVFVDPDTGKESSGVTLIKGTFKTHPNCVKITITKSNNPDAGDVIKDELISNQVGITNGIQEQVYYPYVSEPSLIRYIDEIILNGTENWIYSTNEGGFAYFPNGLIIDKTFNITVKSDKLTAISRNLISKNNDCICGWDSGHILAIRSTNNFDSVAKVKTWLSNNNIMTQYVLSTPTIAPLSQLNINALQTLITYNPITNVFTNNEALANLNLNYVSGYSEQQTTNAYLSLKCWNANTMPYIVHSNHIDIPSETDKVFIWMRRKNNLFDLKIENLGDYNQGDDPKDTSNPIVTIDINQNNVTKTTIPVVSNSIDDTGLKTVRFSKDNGNSWDEIVTVDGLSSTNSYTFINLNPNTTYTIRVEAIDLAGNIGGISQQVTTKS